MVCLIVIVAVIAVASIVNLGSFLISLFFCFIADAVAPVNSRLLQSRIVGGNDTTAKTYPSFAAILFRGVPICGAALVKNNGVLTSLKCVSGYRTNMLQVQVGSDIPGDGEIVNVTGFCNHPLYNISGPTVDYDITFVYISKWIYTSVTIQTIAVRAANLDVPTGKLATVVGFGNAGSTGPANKVLQALDLPRIRDIDCQRAYPYDEITDRMVCFGYPEGGKDACNAGGSPLIYQNTLIGVDSWSFGCAFPNTPRIFARVYNEEIYNHIQKCFK